jgi:hypothetical protein
MSKESGADYRRRQQSLLEPELAARRRPPASNKKFMDKYNLGRFNLFHPG